MSRADTLSSLCEGIEPGEPVTAAPENYPWLSEAVEVSTTLITLADETRFRYGSIIGYNKSLSKIADSVPQSDSDSLQKALFMAMPDVLKGNPTQGISKVQNSNAQANLLAVSRNIVRLPSLIFAVEVPEDKDAPQAVLRAGITVPKNSMKLLRVLGVKQGASRRGR